MRSKLHSLSQRLSGERAVFSGERTFAEVSPNSTRIVLLDLGMPGPGT